MKKTQQKIITLNLSEDYNHVSDSKSLALAKKQFENLGYTVIVIPMGVHTEVITDVAVASWSNTEGDE